jgi:hypothetical protein
LRGQVRIGFYRWWFDRRKDEMDGFAASFEDLDTPARAMPSGTMHEDECRIRKRNGPANFATIHLMTLNPSSAPKPPSARASASNQASLHSTKLPSRPS